MASFFRFSFFIFLALEGNTFFKKMEVLVGPAFTIDVPSSPPRDGGSENRIFLNGSPEKDDGSNFRISGPPKFFAGGESESSSSIGTPDDSDNEEEEVQSQLKIRTGLGSLDAMEDSLPIKLVPLISLSFSHFFDLMLSYSSNVFLFSLRLGLFYFGFV